MALWVTAIVATALVATGCVPSSSPNSPPVLRTSANLLVDGRGHRVVLRGVTLYAVPFEDAGAGHPDPNLQRVTSTVYADRTAIFHSIAATGANVVRIPVSGYSWTHDTYGLGGSAGYLRRLVAIVDAARHAGLYVIIGWWDATAWGTTFPANEPGQAAMMAAVAHAFRHDGRVMFEPFNEPNGIGWSSWQGVVTRTLDLWRRQIGYRGVLILDTIAFSWDFDPAQATVVLDEDRRIAGTPDVVFANHRYANTDTCFCGRAAQAWTDDVERFVGTFPILGDEYGNFNAPFPPQPAWTSQFLAYVGTRSIPAGLNGALAFVWYWVDPNTMTAADAHTLTAYGRQVAADILQSPA